MQLGRPGLATMPRPGPLPTWSVGRPQGPLEPPCRGTGRLARGLRSGACGVWRRPCHVRGGPALGLWGQRALPAGPGGLSSGGGGGAAAARGCGGSRSWRLRPRPLGCAEKLDEILAAAAEPTLRPDIADADSRAATVKQRPTSRRITPAEISVRLGAPGGAGRGRLCAPRGGGASSVPHCPGWL